MNNGNPFGAAIAFWIFVQVVLILALIGGGLYLLWCLNRIASSVERLADAKDNALTAPISQTPNSPTFTPTNAPYHASEIAPTLPDIPSSTR